MMRFIQVQFLVIEFNVIMTKSTLPDKGRFELDYRAGPSVERREGVGGPLGECPSNNPISGKIR